MNKNILKIKRYNIAMALLIAIFFSADRYLKILAFQTFSETSKNLIAKWLSFTFTPNHYIAFSLPLSGLFLNILLAIIIIGLAVWLFKTMRQAKNNFLVFGLLIIIFGALSNFIDRLAYGYVIDYLYLKNFTVFNLADIGISGGSILALVGLNKKPS